MSAPLRQADFWPITAISPASSSEARLAKTSAAPTPAAKASMAKGPASSSKPSASSENAALVGSLLRTALISELGALTPFSLRWRESDTPAGRSWFVLETLLNPRERESALIMSARGHGSSDATLTKLPTPIAGNSGSNQGGGAGRVGPVRHDTKTMIRQSLATPRKTDADRGFRGDVLSQLHGHNSRHAGMLHTPTATANMHHPSMQKWPSCEGWPEIAQGKAETLPTPTKRDKRMDAWSPAYDKRKSPSMDAVMDGALTDRAGDKWVYARQIAAVLTDHGLAGASMTLPAVYGWMMGYPPGWLERALLSAVQKGLLPLPSSSKPMATPSSRKSRKRSDAQS